MKVNSNFAAEATRSTDAPRRKYIFSYHNHVTINIVVEIDGHEFHERTKEQAKRDRMRDRLMLMDGYMVLRYTGSEIYSGLDRVCTELYFFIHEQMKSAAASVGVY
jgi:very-short-patch-repair endonuclease